MIEIVTAVAAGVTIGLGLLSRLLPKLNKLLEVVSGRKGEQNLRQLVEGMRAQIDVHENRLDDHEVRLTRLEV